MSLVSSSGEAPELHIRLWLPPLLPGEVPPPPGGLLPGALVAVAEAGLTVVNI